MAKALRLAPDVDTHRIARRTAGYVGADFKRLMREAIYAAVERITNHTLMAQQHVPSVQMQTSAPLAALATPTALTAADLDTALAKV